VQGSGKMIGGDGVWIVGALSKEGQGISQWALQAANGARQKEKEILKKWEAEKRKNMTKGKKEKSLDIITPEYGTHICCPETSVANHICTE
jgi:hypothetical protein